jgi:hypothetical protein
MSSGRSCAEACIGIATAAASAVAWKEHDLIDRKALAELALKMRIRRALARCPGAGGPRRPSSERLFPTR